MAYKPYKPKKEKDIYARYDGKNTKANNYDNGSVKLFGFRSGAVYKMVPAILYYAFMIFYIGTGIYGELSYYKFEPNTEIRCRYLRNMMPVHQLLE